MLWLPEPSPDAVRDALRGVAPDLADPPLAIRDVAGRDQPLWQASSAVLGEGYVVKFAWSEPAARRVVYEIDVLTALADTVPFLPRVIAAAVDPVLLVTRRIPGASLFAIVGDLDLDRAGAHLAEFLVALHRTRVPHAREASDGPQHPSSTSALRSRLGRWMRSDMRWYDWIDAVLAAPRPHVLVHADLHGDNQVWSGGELRLVVDFETAGLAEPEYDLRLMPGTGPDVELLSSVMRHYLRLAGRELDIERVLAWHVLSTLSDALWRCEAGIPLPDGVRPRNGPPTWPPGWPPSASVRADPMR